MFILEPTSVKVTLEYVSKNRTDYRDVYDFMYRTIIVTGCCAVDAISFAKLTYGDLVSDISKVIPESEIDPKLDRKFTPVAEYLFSKGQPAYDTGWLEGYADGESKGREAGYRAGYQDGRKARSKNDRKHQPKPAREFDDSWAYIGNDDMDPRGRGENVADLREEFEEVYGEKV